MYVNIVIGRFFKTRNVNKGFVPKVSVQYSRISECFTTMFKVELVKE